MPAAIEGPEGLVDDLVSRLLRVVDQIAHRAEDLYLRPLADLSAEVDRAAAGIEVLDARIPDWDDYRLDFLAGVPLLSSADAAVDPEPGGLMAAALLERLAAGTSPEWLAAEARALDGDLRGAPNVSRRIADFLLGEETITPPFPGLLRYLGGRRWRGTCVPW